MTKLIILNGPPRSGKDAAAAALWRTLDDSMIIRMSGPIKRALEAMFEFTHDERKLLEKSKGRTRDEDTPLPILFGRKWPGTQISFSEGWAKPFFGNEVFGKLFARKLQRSSAKHVICPDGGFAAEWEAPLATVGRSNTLLIKLHREGCSFVGDSRSYLNLDRVTTLSIINNGELRRFEEHVTEVVKQWLALGK